MFEKSSQCGKRHLICSSGLKVFYRTKNKSNSCVKSLSSSNVSKTALKLSFEVKNGLFSSSSNIFTHRDRLSVVKPGKNLYQNRFFETFHVLKYRDTSIVDRRGKNLYQNEFSETYHVQNPEKHKKRILTTKKISLLEFATVSSSSALLSSSSFWSSASTSPSFVVISNRKPESKKSSVSALVSPALPVLLSLSLSSSSLSAFVLPNGSPSLSPLSSSVSLSSSSSSSFVLPYGSPSLSPLSSLSNRTSSSPISYSAAAESKLVSVSISLSLSISLSISLSVSTSLLVKSNVITVIHCIITPLLYLNLSVVSIAKAWSCPGTPSIITSISLSCYQSHFFVTSKPVVSTNRIEVVVSRLLRYYQSSLRGIKLELSFNKFIYFKITHVKESISCYCYCYCHFHREPVNSKMTSQIIISWMRGVLMKSGDVELNPGPEERVLISLNCRGLKKESKFKQLLNRIQISHGYSKTIIVALQETHREVDNLKYVWKGNYIFTKGSGSKGGVITLLGENIKVLEDINIGLEAHIGAVQIIENNVAFTVIIANIHAPCTHGHEKLDFFLQVKEHVENLATKYDTSQFALLGDYNTTFNQFERLNTTRCRSEEIIALKLQDILLPLSLMDCWSQNDLSMTWRHGSKMSRIDRIQFSDDFITESKTTVDWTYTDSDHGAVIVEAKPVRVTKKHNITRIDVRFMTNITLRTKFIKDLTERLTQLEETILNPHDTLEFLKMCIRSIAIEIASNHKKETEQEYKDIKKEIDFWQCTYEAAQIDGVSNYAQVKLEEATNRRDKYLEDRGRYLCDRAKTKWYQEGERGTKYFLNILRSRTKQNEMTELTTSNGLTKDRGEIKTLVQNFYRSLYERGDPQHSGDASEFLSNMSTLDSESIGKIIEPITQDELLNTLKTCQDSAPGPDGLPYSLIKLIWPIYGPILLKAWHYSLKIGHLPISHTSSYLRLIPKDGKDISQLKNWRPITLSNCDIKVITKTLANRLALNLTSVISHSQTAYMKGRQITDNLQIMQYLITKSNETLDEAMIVSLDAEKAFDSISHSYIRSTLEKIGLNEFRPIFDLLYRDQKVDIILNNQTTGSYKIKNGVKQGDALSCILFILGIEPLLRNVEQDRNLENIVHNESKLPKIISYADDVACLIHPSQANLDIIFKHYEKMTSISGLKLNADKTELIQLGGEPEYKARYNGKTTKITPSNVIKINGLQLSFDCEMAVNLNLNKIYSSMEKQFKLWHGRYLSILGKILIYKTFGLSQILFIGSTVVISPTMEKRLNELIYKFIWNNSLDNKKAPDRIKRSILNASIRNLGFGMIDFREVIRSIRIANFFRLGKSVNSPMHLILKNSLNNSRIHIASLNKLSPVLEWTIKDLNKTWKNLIKECPQESRNYLYKIIGEEYVGNVLVKRFQKQRLGLLHRHDTISELLFHNKSHPIMKKIDKNIANFIRDNLDLPVTISKIHVIPTKTKLLTTDVLSTKIIRNLNNPQTILQPKMTETVEINKLARLGNIINKMKNIKLRSIILRGIHGDIYCGTRLKKFKMSESDACPRCNEPETIEHQLLKCQYVQQIWNICKRFTSIQCQKLDEVFGIHDFHDKTTLTVHSEIIRRLLSIERPTNDPIKLVSSVVDRLSIVERGISRHIITSFKKVINDLTQSTTVLVLASESSSDPDPSWDIT